MSETPTTIAVAIAELLLLCSGVFLLWRHGFSRAARERQRMNPPALETWNIRSADFLLFVLVIIGGSLLASVLSGLLVRNLDVSADTKTVLNSAAFQLGLLIGAALLPLQLGHHPARPPLDRSTLLSGGATFLIALPVVTLVNVAWLAVLELCGLPAEQQDLLRMFSQADSAWVLLLMVVLATLVAPLTEELLFRATLFRFLRTRVPRWIALLLPGTIFAALHVEWSELDGLASFVPLITLAVVFSIAYERTGRIGTAVVAHALFNLHTILILLSGVTAEI